MDQFIRNPRPGKENRQLKMTIMVFAGFLLGITALAGIGQAEHQQPYKSDQVQFTQRS
ncbi:MAG: hypothetical protein JJ858_02480 [Rhizobiaceae bacterium]|nr:hypothetical protein [Rhizobiaceae bacterium]